MKTKEITIFFKSGHITEKQTIGRAANEIWSNNESCLVETPYNQFTCDPKDFKKISQLEYFIRKNYFAKKD